MISVIRGNSGSDTQESRNRRLSRPCPAHRLVGNDKNKLTEGRRESMSAINAGGFNSRVRLDRFVSPQVDINEAVKIESNVGTVEAVKNELGEREQR